jgi:hypothetical protein
VAGPFEYTELSPAIAFALTSIAADMGLQLTNDRYKVFPVLLGAIAQRAKCRCTLLSSLIGHAQVVIEHSVFFSILGIANVCLNGSRGSFNVSHR